MASTYSTMTIEDAVIDFLINTDDTTHNVVVRMAREDHGEGLKYGSDRALGEAIRDAYGDDITGQLGTYVNWAVVGKYYREQAELQ
jgi:hypothetical protein